MFKQCQNLPPMHCWAGVQAVSALSEHICRALCCRGASCLSGVGTFLLGTVLQVAGCLNGVQTYLPGTVLQSAGC